MLYSGKSLEDAITRVMVEKLEPGVGGIIGVSNRGEIVMQHNTPGMSCGAADSSGRYETHLSLPAGGVTEKTAESNPASTIESLLQQQVKDWNAGDIDGFMRPYWQSDQLTFSSGGNVTRGFQATLEGYKERYPDKKTMGSLTFDSLEFLPLGSEAMQVLGVWKLDRDEDPIRGRFTLVLRHFPEGWKIVHDHTSKTPSADESGE